MNQSEILLCKTTIRMRLSASDRHRRQLQQHAYWKSTYGEADRPAPSAELGLLTCWSCQCSWCPIGPTAPAQKQRARVSPEPRGIPPAARVGTRSRKRTSSAVRVGRSGGGRQWGRGLLQGHRECLSLLAGEWSWGEGIGPHEGSVLGYLNGVRCEQAEKGDKKWL